MDRLQRITWALLLVAAGCGDDVTGGEGSTGDESSTGSSTVDPTNPTTTINPTGGTSTGDPTDGTTTDDTDGTTTDGSTTDDTDGSTTDDTDGSTTDDTEGTTGMPEDCGNAMIDDPEECDGAELGGATCESEGFVSGDLACAKDCTFDTSSCETCGDGVIDEGDVCDGAELNGADCTTLGMGFTGGVLGCSAACEYDTAACTSFAQPAAGEVVITEIMPNPAVVGDSDGEWFEIYNPSGDTSYQLMGCEFTGGATEAVIPVDVDLVIPPGGYLTIARDSDLDIGFTPDLEWTVSHSLGNSGDTLALECGVVVDTVSYGNNDEPGQSFNLDVDLLDAVSNDDTNNWCYGTDVYATGMGDPAPTDAGTPGAVNNDCPEPVVYTIDNCRVQHPDAISDETGASVDIYGRVEVVGLTDMTPQNDLAAELSGQLGYGPDGTDPAVDGGWTWIDASPNPGYPGDNPEATYDEYQVSLTLPTPGEYDYAFRFSGDSETSYTYCDTGTGSSDGYAVADAGQLTSTGEIVAPTSLVLAEVYYNEPGGDNGYEWIKLYNGTDSDIDLAGYSIGHGGTDYTYGTYQLSGTIPAGGCFVAGGPNASADNGFGDTPAYDLDTNIDPDIQNSGGTADGVALFNVTADMIAADTVPVDAVIFGGTNSNSLIDETGVAPEPHVGNAPDDDSIVLVSEGSWVIQADPTPTACAFATPDE